MRVRERGQGCEPRCWGTLLSEPFCVFNLLTQFQRSGVHGGVLPVFGPSVIAQQLHASWAVGGQTIPCTPFPSPSSAASSSSPCPSSLPHSPVFHSVICPSPFISPLAPFFNLLLPLKNLRWAASENMWFKGDVREQPQPGECYGGNMGRKDMR